MLLQQIQTGAFICRAMNACNEKDYPAIRRRYGKYLGDKRVDGLLFKWLHLLW